MGNVTNIAEYRRHENYRIKICKGLWRGFDVEIEPQTATHPLRHFKTYDEAMACALMIQRAEGWPIFTPGTHENGGGSCL